LQSSHPDPAVTAMLRRATCAVSRALPQLERAAASRNCTRAVSTSSSALTKPKFPEDDADMAAARKARREAAEAEAAKSVRAWSSPLFSHVEVEVDDGRVIPRWANVAFVAGVFLVFGFAGRFALQNERRKSERKQRAAEEREARARVAIESGTLLNDARRNFAGADDEDPFEGMSPEEIEKLAESRRR
jgi:uncharacterized protein (DUF58 family)